MRDDYFCIFIGFMKGGKISGLKEWAELVASQLTQMSTNANKINKQENKSCENLYGEKCVYLDFTTP